MATLTAEDFQSLKKRIKADAPTRAEFKAWGLDKTTWYELFQAVEDWFVNGFSTAPATSFKAAVEAVTGATTVARAKAVALVWMGWRYGANP